MKKIIQFGQLFVFLLSFSIKTNASHLSGGELRYTYLGNNLYEISAVLYRDCNGIQMNSFIELTCNAPSIAASFTDSLILVSGSGISIPSACPSVVTTCQGGLPSVFGFEKYLYKKTFILPPASDWTMTIYQALRTGGITNIISPASTIFQISCSLNNFNFPFNNSPVFSNDPVLILSVNSTAFISNGIYDPDGDSISVSLAPAEDGTSTVTYQSGFTFFSPISVSGTMMLDSTNGDLYLTPSTPETDIVVYLISEYRNGQLIGHTKRENIVHVIANNNHLPSINYTFPFVATACYGDTLNLSIVTSDLDLNDSTFIDTIFNNLPTGSFQYSLIPGKNQSAQLIFISDSTMVSSTPYTFTIKVRDNACSMYGIQYYSFRLYTNNCNSLVWPGDADSDSDVDIYDVLPIGIAYNSNGLSRMNASTNWVGQPSPFWGSNFISGVNYMHADCNGNGIIDSADLNSVNLNYGLIHPLRVRENNNLNHSVGTLSLKSSVDSMMPGVPFSLKISLGDSISAVNNIYGIAFRISFNPQLIDTSASSILVSNSWIGSPGVNLISFIKKFWSLGYIDVCLVRTDMNNVTGGGMIGELMIQFLPTASPQSNSYFNVSGIKAIDNIESLISLNSEGDTVLVSALNTGVTQEFDLSKLIIYVNQITENLIIDFSNQDQMIHDINLYDLNGKKVIASSNYSKELTLVNIDLGSIKQGVYIVEVLTPNNIFRKSFLKN
jgi:Secretion system C-terminal sorting domain